MRPALDLIAQVPPLPPGDVVDLGCGAGAVAAALRAAFCSGDAPRRLIGVDASPAMLAEARATGAYDLLAETDACEWRPDEQLALIFSNAALHWLGDHEALMPRLACLLPAGGVLAVQMPGQHDAPSHRLIHASAAALFPGRFPADPPAAVERPEDYLRRLAPLGRVVAWETTYVQPLESGGPGHPVRRFTQATAMRPYLAALRPDEQAALLARYDADLAQAYPADADGSVLFPFRRVFFVLTRD